MYLYRYIDKFGSDGPTIQEIKYKVIKTTPKGYRIDRVYDRGRYEIPSRTEKWIKKDMQPHKKFAFETKEEALRQYRYRKAAQVRILRGRLKAAESLFQRALREDTTYDPKRDWHWGIDKAPRVPSSLVLNVYPKAENPDNFIKIEEFNI